MINTTHIIEKGKTLCGFISLLKVFPAGHNWVGRNDIHLIKPPNYICGKCLVEICREDAMKGYKENRYKGSKFYGDPGQEHRVTHIWDGTDWKCILPVGEITTDMLKPDRPPLTVGYEGSAPAVPAEPILQFFSYAHLPEHLQFVSLKFYNLAHQIVEHLPRNPERTVALRKLLEAKDAAVRATIMKMPDESSLSQLTIEEARELDQDPLPEISKSMQFPCPGCGAEAGQPCTDSKDNTLIELHRERDAYWDNFPDSGGVPKVKDTPQFWRDLARLLVIRFGEGTLETWLTHGGKQVNWRWIVI